MVSHICMLIFVICMIGMVYATAFQQINEGRPKSNIKEIATALRKYHRLYEKREVYLKAFETNKEYYYALDELYKRLGALTNQCEREILHAPLQMTRPVEPSTAAFWGTLVGGAAVGMVAAQNAIDKEMAYQKNVKDVIESKIKMGNAHDKAEYCYQSIEAILSKNAYTSDDWNREKQLIFLR